MVSCKGNTYCIASDKEKPELGVSLLMFDYSTDKFGRVPLPYQSPYLNACLSVVREEKLSVLLQQKVTSKTEIWVTNKIGESNKGVSWSKVLALDLGLRLGILDYASFLFDEEKKVVMCCDRLTDDIDMVYIVGEDNIVTQVEIGVNEFDGCWPAILNYFPSLAQIEPARGKKRKRLERMDDLIEGKPDLEAIDIIKNRLNNLGRDVEAIRGLALAEIIPFAMSELEDDQSDLHSLLEAQLDKIGEINKGVSWRKVLALDLSLDLHLLSSATFLLDEEKKVIVLCDAWVDENEVLCNKDMVYIVGEDNIVTELEFGVDKIDDCWPAILTYFPSLAQIEQARGKKRNIFERRHLIEGKNILEASNIIKKRRKTLDEDVEAQGDVANTRIELDWLQHAQQKMCRKHFKELGISISSKNDLSHLRDLLDLLELCMK
ncbi:unnamed protein product [Microthlaspi erraticum]|uniref:F-box associated beta-propeller type 1 domain-containing protein n=1 Tax=Microthlaspi erraticum TaxID=1685480 RepID=A0A6D2KE71_9BRAS|nr:unnamed protein product [Microthlaspi erraticum]